MLQKGRIPVARYARAGSPALAESVIAPLEESDAILLSNHGVLTVDAASLAEALLKAAYVEEIAEVYCHARLLAKGEPPHIPPEDLACLRLDNINIKMNLIAKIHNKYFSISYYAFHFMLSRICVKSCDLCAISIYLSAVLNSLYRQEFQGPKHTNQYDFSAQIILFFFALETCALFQ